MEAALLLDAASLPAKQARDLLHDAQHKICYSNGDSPPVHTISIQLFAITGYQVLLPFRNIFVLSNKG